MNKNKMIVLMALSGALLTFSACAQSHITTDSNGRWVGGMGSMRTNFNAVVDEIVLIKAELEAGTGGVPENYDVVSSNALNAASRSYADSLVSTNHQGAVSINGFPLSDVAPVYPPTVHVSGAGTIGANGTYQYVAFRKYKNVTEKSTGSYYLEFDESNDSWFIEKNSFSDVDVYRSGTATETVIPTTTWYTTTSGLDPVPTLTYNPPQKFVGSKEIEVITADSDNLIAALNIRTADAKYVALDESSMVTNSVTVGTQVISVVTWADGRVIGLYVSDDPNDPNDPNGELGDPVTPGELANLLGLPYFAAIEPTTTYPAGSVAFEPVIGTEAVAVDVPVIYEYSRTASPGSTIVLAGSDFSSYTNSLYAETIEASYGILSDIASSRVRPKNDFFDNTAVEIEFSFWQTPDEDDVLIYATGGTEAKVAYESGDLVAYGGGSSVNLGPPQAGINLLKYDANNLEVTLNGSVSTLPGVMTSARYMAIGQQSSGYRMAEMSLYSAKFWVDDVLVEDIAPTSGDRFYNTLNESDIYLGVGDADIHVAAERSLINSGEQGSDTAVFVYSDSGVYFADVLRVNSDDMAFTLPAGLTDGNVCMAWVHNSNGWSEPIVINQADAWWAGPKTFEDGASFSMYGRNLKSGTQAYVAELDQWLTPSYVNPFKATFTFPSGAANGEYTAYLHNGTGMAFGWSAPITLTVADDHAWNGTILDVTAAPYNATGDGVTDDTAALRAAWDAANGTGGGLYLPTGTYVCSANFPGGTDMKMYGDGIGVTTLLAPWTAEDQGCLFDGAYTDFAVSNMSLISPESVSNLTFLGQLSGSNVQFDNVEIKRGQTNGNYTSSSFRIYNCDEFAVRNCKIYNFGNPGQLSFNGSSNGQVTSNEFILGWENSQTIGASGSENIDYSGNTFTPCTVGEGDPETDGRILTVGSSPSYHCYYGGNTTTDCAPSENHPNVNTGEQMLFESGRTVERGLAVSGTTNTITLAEILNSPAIGESVAIVDGLGKRQWRMITAINGNVLTVDRDWRVIPDATSRYIVSQASRRWAFYNNTFDGKDVWVGNSTASASTAINQYGAGLDFHFEDNVITDMRMAMTQYALTGSIIANYDVYGLQPIWWNYYRHNAVTNCHRGIAVSSAVNSLPRGMDGGVFASQFDGNSLHTIADYTIKFNNSGTNSPMMQMIGFSGNSFTDSTNTFQSTLGMGDVLLTDNDIDLRGGYAYFVPYDITPVMVGNTVTGGSSYSVGGDYLDPGPVLHVANRWTTNGTVRVSNIGSYPMTVDIPNVTNAQIAAQSSLDVSGLIPGNYTATSGTQTNSFTVQ